MEKQKQKNKNKNKNKNTHLLNMCVQKRMLKRECHSTIKAPAIKNKTKGVGAYVCMYVF